MRIVLTFGAVLGACAVLAAPSALAQCFPVTADIVSLGEKTAMAYARRSMSRGIADEKERIESTGSSVARVTEPAIDCKPFPNILGADEWRCTGSAKVCAK